MFKRLLIGLLSALLCCGFCACGPAKEPGKEDNILDKFPYYVNPDVAAYDFGERGDGWENNEKVYTPYWKGNVIYNETVMCVDDGTAISGKLQYKPLKILSVRDFSFETEYQEETDYTVDGNTITLPRTTSIPYLTKENLLGENVPAPYVKQPDFMHVGNDGVSFCMLTANVIFTESSLLYGHQVSVSYVYDVNDVNIESFSQYGTVAPKFLEKLQNGANVSVGITGDSVAEGCSASAKLNHDPYMPSYFDLTIAALEKEYAGTVEPHNIAIGGQTSALAPKQVDQTIAFKPDVMFLHFGLNDTGGVSEQAFRDNIEEYITAVHEKNPETEFVFIKCSRANDNWVSPEKLERYWDKMDRLARLYDYFYCVDMYNPVVEMFRTKKYMDVTANGCNHINDYMTRLYAMNITNAFINFDNK